MNQLMKKFLGKFSSHAPLDPEGENGVAVLGHRRYVGGMWDEIGNLQFEFLLSKGLRPESVLIDVACGSLRLGVKVIPFLESTHYLGIEKEATLVKAGLEQELDKNIREEKKPVIVISDAFEFYKLGKKANFAIAQSLFTHLPSSLIELCFKNLFPCLEGGGVFYATYFETDKKITNPNKPHDHGAFFYTKKEMCGFGEKFGYQANYIGDWNHPRRQVMVEYKKPI